jgi:hypothetical protein
MNGWEVRFETEIWIGDREQEECVRRSGEIGGGARCDAMMRASLS